MGLFKKAKKAVKGVVKSAIDHPLATAAGLALSAGLGPAGMGLTTSLTAAGIGSAASALLSGDLKLGGKKKGPDPESVPASPVAALPPVTADAALRAQEGGQYAEGGAVLGAGVDLLGDTSIDEVKRRRASRTLLG